MSPLVVGRDCHSGDDVRCPDCGLDKALERYLLTPAGAAYLQGWREAQEDADARAEAARQAAKDRDREPDRWPTGRAR